MALLDIFKRKRKSQERIETAKNKPVREKDKEGEEKSEALKEVSNFVSDKDNRFELLPHITEKSTALKDRGAYVFKIRGRANKVLVRSAIRSKYGVNPIKINIVNLPDKKILNRRSGKFGIKSGLKKALVYLKKGEKIDIS